MPENQSDLLNVQTMSHFNSSGFQDGNGAAAIVGDSATALANQPAGCLNATGFDAGGYLFYQVLAER